MAIKCTVAIFLLFLMQCQNDDTPFDDTPVDDTSLVGEWLLTESYVSPGGATEWKTYTKAIAISSMNSVVMKEPISIEVYSIQDLMKLKKRSYIYILLPREKKIL